jgi:hypothetical protein
VAVHTLDDRTPFLIDGLRRACPENGAGLVYEVETGEVKALKLNPAGSGTTTIWTGGWTLGWS